MKTANTSIGGNEKKNIHRDEFCRRGCFTAAEREEAINKILGITPQERRETLPEAAPAPNIAPGVPEECRNCPKDMTEGCRNSDQGVTEGWGALTKV
jgi:hypothetical protein